MANFMAQQIIKDLTQFGVFNVKQFEVRYLSIIRHEHFTFGFTKAVLKHYRAS